MSTFHHADTAPSSVHVVMFVDSADPAGTPSNNVAAGKLWFDTTNTLLKKRNVGNAGWDVVATQAHGDLSGLTTGDPHIQYVTKALATTKGDLLAATASATLARLGAGTDGFVLIADSSAASGLRWGEFLASALAALSDVALTAPASGERLEYDGSAWINVSTTNDRRLTLAVQLGDGASAIDSTTEREQWIECNFNGTIEGVSLLADAAGSIVVDIWKAAYASYPPTVADTITASAKPTLSTAAKAQDSTLTGWTTTIARGDVLKFHVDSAATVKAVTLNLRIIKT